MSWRRCFRVSGGISASDGRLLESSTFRISQFNNQVWHHSKRLG